MATFYISPSGNDGTGDGSIGNPWKTLHFACVQVVSPGNIIHVNAGTYLETSVIVLAPGVSIEGDGRSNTIIQSTITGDWVQTFQMRSLTPTDGNQHISGLQFDGRMVNAESIRVGARSNVKIFNCEFKDFTQQGVNFEARHDGSLLEPTVYMTGNEFHDNIMNNCAGYINGAFGLGCLNIGGQDGMLVYNNTITQNSRANGLNGWPIKYNWDGWFKNLKIYNNVLTKNIMMAAYGGAGDWAFTMELWHVEGGLEIYGNTFINGELDLVQVRKRGSAFGAHIHDNLFYGSGGAPLNATGCLDFEVGAESVIIENNKCYNVSFFSLFQTEWFSDSSGDVWEVVSIIHDIIVRNNLVYNVGINGGAGANTFIQFPSNGGPSPLLNQLNINNVYIYNNTFSGITSGGSQPQFGILFNPSYIGTVGNVFIRNNIFQNCDVATIGVYHTEVWSTLTVENNLFYNSGTPVYFNDVVPTTYVNNNNITGSNPNFAETVNYTLNTSTSPAMNAGQNVGIPYYGAAPEIGYWEYNPGGNILPSVNAGSNQNITLPISSVTLSGSATDSDGTIISQIWSQISGPNSATIVSPSSYTTSVNNLVQGTYVFRLTVQDNQSAQGTDDVQITVNAAVGLIRVKRKIRVI